MMLISDGVWVSIFGHWNWHFLSKVYLSFCCKCEPWWLGFSRSINSGSLYVSKSGTISNWSDFSCAYFMGECWKVLEVWVVLKPWMGSISYSMCFVSKVSHQSSVFEDVAWITLADVIGTVLAVVASFARWRLVQKSGLDCKVYGCYGRSYG